MKKAIRLAQTAGVYFPERLRELHGLIHTIQEAGINVNTFEKIPDTRQFHRFFDGSKAVDENGEPLVLYHQTHSAF